jgi:ABC-type polysaccharide/polyol phosphate transport system ATPase subunit
MAAGSWLRSGLAAEDGLVTANNRVAAALHAQVATNPDTTGRSGAAQETGLLGIGDQPSKDTGQLGVSGGAVG